MTFFHKLFYFLDNLRSLVSDIVLLGRVFFQIVEFYRSLWIFVDLEAHAFEVAETHCLFASFFVKLPIEVFVLGLFLA